jgi:hypothetical protein
MSLEGCEGWGSRFGCICRCRPFFRIDIGQVQGYTIRCSRHQSAESASISDDNQILISHPRQKIHTRLFRLQVAHRLPDDVDSLLLGLIDGYWRKDDVARITSRRETSTLSKRHTCEAGRKSALKEGAAYLGVTIGGNPQTITVVVDLVSLGSVRSVLKDRLRSPTYQETQEPHLAFPSFVLQKLRWPLRLSLSTAHRTRIPARSAPGDVKARAQDSHIRLLLRLFPFDLGACSPRI